MSTEGKNHCAAHILAMGLTDSEKSFLRDLYSKSDHEIIFSNTDMDMWDHADHEKYDLCIVGQDEESRDVNYTTWLLKGIVKPSQIVVVTNNDSKPVKKRLKKHRIRFILSRPLYSDTFSETIEKALRYNKPWYVRLISW